MIRPYIEKDPTAFYNADEFEEAVSNLQKFCDLRTRSIRGQLEGEIPSTRAGQSEAPEQLLSAGDLNVSAMGGMGGGMGPGNSGEGGGFPGSGGPPGGGFSGSGGPPGGGFPGGNFPGNSSSGTSNVSSEENAASQDDSSKDAFPSFGGPGGPPGMEFSPESTGPSTNDWLIAGGCLVLLLLSLFLLRRGRSHNR
jgi:LPXTG-motif cell wall-anchored protein